VARLKFHLPYNKANGGIFESPSYMKGMMSYVNQSTGAVTEFAVSR
jgi:hypothetical protein